MQRIMKIHGCNRGRHTEVMEDNAGKRLRCRQPSQSVFLCCRQQGTNWEF